MIEKTTEEASESLKLLLNDVQISKGLFTKTVGCDFCNDRIEVSYVSLNNSENEFEVWRIEGTYQIFCWGCADALFRDPVSNEKQTTMCYAEWNTGGDARDQEALVSDDTAEGLMDRFIEFTQFYDEMGEEYTGKVWIHHEYAVKVKHFASVKILKDSAK